MAHEVESMFFTREVPWHGLGEDYRGRGLLTAIEAVNATPELASKVEHWPFYAVNPDNADEYVHVTNKWEVVRKLDQKPLGEVQNGHELFQTEDLARFVDDICGTDAAKFETGGSLRGGQVVWFLAQLTDDMMVGNDKDETLRSYIFVQDWRHGGALSIKRTNIRVVCMNTLDAARRGFGEEFNIRHTVNADQRVEAAQRALKISVEQGSHFQTVANDLITRKFTEKDFVGMVGKVFPVKDDATKVVKARSEDRVAELVDVLKHSPDLQNINGTAWGAYNAFAEWVDFKYTAKSESEQKLERRFTSIMSSKGAGARIKDKALAALTA
jgi:phage/plasmid-like protein (TIGR03299 family)